MVKRDSYEDDIFDEAFTATMERAFIGWYVALVHDGVVVHGYCLTAWGARWWVKRVKASWERDIRREKEQRVWIL